MVAAASTTSRGSIASAFPAGEATVVRQVSGGQAQGVTLKNDGLMVNGPH